MSETVKLAQVIRGKKWVEAELHKQLVAAECEWGAYHSEHEVFLLTVVHGGKTLTEKFLREQLEDCEGAKGAGEEIKKQVSNIILAFRLPEQKHEKHLFVSERIAVRAFIRKVRGVLGGSLCDLRMFGSKIKGMFDLDSDIDILLVIDSDDWRVKGTISGIAADINMEYDSNISPVIYSKTEYDKNRHSNTLFVQEVNRTGVAL